MPVCYLFRTFPQIFSDVWKEMYVARDIFSLFLLHLCRKLQRRAPFWGQSGRKSFTTKTFPLPYSATAPLFPTSDDLHVQSSRCFFTAVLSTKFAVRRFCKIRSKNFCHFGKNGSYLHPQREMFWEVNIPPYGQWLGQGPSIQGTHNMTNVCHRLYCSLNFWPHCEKILYSLYDKF